MNKNRMAALFILILIVAGIAFWVVWGVVLNKGTIVFSYPRPSFFVQIAEEQKTCLTQECEFWIPVGPRTYTITKDGYYEKTGSVNIARDKKVTENVLLEFIPQAAEGTTYKTYQLPAGYSKFSESLKEISLFAELPENPELKGLPKILNNLIFSPKGGKAVVFEQNKTSQYSTGDFSLKEMDGMEVSMSAVFSKDESELYAVSYDESAKKYALKKISLNSDTPAESLVYFGRDVKNYELKISDSGGLVALADKTFSPEILYIIDLNAKSRTNIFEGYLIETGSWSASGEVFIFKAKGLNENFSSLYYYTAESKAVQKLDVDANIKDISFLDGLALFVSSQSYQITNYSVPYSIQFEEEAAPSTIEGINAEDAGGKSMILAKWNLADGQFYLVKDLSGIISNVPEKIELSSDGKTVRMLIDGLIYDIRISE